MKKFKQKSDTFITILLLIGILALVNYFSSNIFFRWDLTENKDYSISEVTKRTLGDLDDVVNIKAYFSNRLPTQFVSHRQNVADILDNYENYSNGKVRAEFIDPAEDEEAQRNLRFQGIPELQFEVYERDQLQLVKGYLGIVVQHGDESEAIPVVRDTESLEYQLTLAIKKVTSEETVAVGMIASNGARASGQMEELSTALRELYALRDVELSEDEITEIDPGIKTLLLIGPKEVFSENQLRALDIFVSGGGNLLALVDGVTIGEGLQAEKNEIGLNELLENYGIRLNNDLVLETVNKAGVASFNQGFFTFSTNYPYWPKVTEEGFNDESSAVSRIQSVTFPWVSSIEVLEENIGEGQKLTRLAETSDSSWRVSESFNLNPQQQFSPTSDKGRSLVAVQLEGQFQSPYGNESQGSSKVVLVSDSDFLSPNMSRSGEGFVLVQNLVDSLSLDEDLIEVRSKSITNKPISDDLSDGAKAFIRYLNVFGITILVIAFGLIRYYMRRKSRFADEL